ncbi:MAG TPA: SGNH/GDSL hydrolase family protein [Gemmatimonadaceae bacterium]|nr:SGNH/GDSL hydrolase family protein [Gemmatimonadaceae bacterium]
MTSHKLRAGTVALAGLALALAACTDDSVDVLAPKTTPVNPIFASYVALGNSITAGYQSSGINDSTQRRSYAFLLAQQMKTQFNYPALAGFGCAPPIANFQSQIRVGGGTSGSACSLRDPASANAVLNNVAVPGAASVDLMSTSSPYSNILTSLFLGGKPQVIKALDAEPTFATVWMGNNDVLDAAAKGVTVSSTGTSAPEIAVKTALSTPGVTPVNTFIANYSLGINTLVKARPNVKGVLIGVVNVTAIPLLFKAQTLFNAQFKAAFDQYAGGTVTVDASCATDATTLLSFAIVSAMRAGSLPRTVTCTKTAGQPVGDFFMLDATEQTSFNTTITGYNNYIKAKADSIGFAYLDPNVLLAQLKTSGDIPSVPNLGSATAPYGAYISLDGVHPSTLAHRAFANAMITTINAKYGTNLATVSVP